MKWKKIALWSAVAVAAIAIAAVLIVRTVRWRPRAISIQGAVIRNDSDPNKRLPIAGVAIVATDGRMTATTQSDASGYFNLNYRESVWPGQKLLIQFSNPDYQPLSITIPLKFRSVTKRLFVESLTPVRPEDPTATSKKLTQVSNIRIRYTVNTQSDENVGSAVNTFEVKNEGNVPCNRQAPCSPDGIWKAATGSATLDAGPGSEFRNARASCIAGPCPFTRIDASGFERGGRVITASALDWSGTATFLLEAEVFRQSLTSSVRESYPVIFGRALNFVLPGSQEGPSIEAELDGTPIVFPLGPDLYLSWATCTSRGSHDSGGSTVFRCELKPGYRF